MPHAPLSYLLQREMDMLDEIISHPFEPRMLLLRDAKTDLRSVVQRVHGLPAIGHSRGNVHIDAVLLGYRSLSVAHLAHLPRHHTVASAVRATICCNLVMDTLGQTVRRTEHSGASAHRTGSDAHAVAVAVATRTAHGDGDLHGHALTHTPATSTRRSSPRGRARAPLPGSACAGRRGQRS